MVFQFKELCFDLLTAPTFFSRVFTLVSTWVIQQGRNILICYLDNSLVLTDFLPLVFGRPSPHTVLSRYGDCHHFGNVELQAEIFGLASGDALK